MKHVHADLIIAWAEGAEIECFDTEWLVTDRPAWEPNWQYRIKPREPRRFWVNTNPDSNVCYQHDNKEAAVKYCDYNGETIEVVEVIKDE